MLARFAFLILICALVVPNAAWGAHLSGHERLSSDVSVHTHHADHAHEQISASVFADEQERDQSGPAKGLTHDHSPSLSLTTALLVPNDANLAPVPAAAAMHFDRTYAADALSRPESLLRPPRGA